ncbi:putative odorant-binding protein A10 [Nasonia vitripennis]|uniref:Uncharacterized protein n=1 Tax=Nasonia vitripennis TaxID=7425 RepID=A0A7M7HCD3_NASVI|nr:putative odorant-binding protein A10 [Nasonia vitripennis]XP_032455745.1 putative odorant-binding protein A10 [Nasonia vitripennis]XP_032455746.1 putative odorant-binding protein A10 [Nasonia vitripennis]
MSKYGVYLTVLAVLLMVGVTQAQEKKEEIGDHYPKAWLEIDFKPIVDNDRLFKKYKECLLADKLSGCPRDVTQFKKLIPEIIETECAKCLPEHIAKFKEGLEYICQKRRADYEEVRKIRDPSGALRRKFEEKFGSINC